MNFPQDQIDPELARLLEAPRHIRMTEEELCEQRISFAYGNGVLDNPAITKEGVRQAAARLALVDGE